MALYRHGHKALFHTTILSDKIVRCCCRFIKHTWRITDWRFALRWKVLVVLIHLNDLSEVLNRRSLDGFYQIILSVIVDWWISTTDTGKHRSFFSLVFVTCLMMFLYLYRMALHAYLRGSVITACTTELHGSTSTLKKQQPILHKWWCQKITVTSGNI